MRLVFQFVLKFALVVVSLGLFFSGQIGGGRGNSQDEMILRDPEIG